MQEPLSVRTRLRRPPICFFRKERLGVLRGNILPENSERVVIGHEQDIAIFRPARWVIGARVPRQGPLLSEPAPVRFYLGDVYIALRFPGGCDNSLSVRRRADKPCGVANPS